MPTRRPGFFALTCLLLVAGLNACRADNETNAKGGTAATKKIPASEAKQTVAAGAADLAETG